MAEAGPNESVFTWAAPPLKFGVGALDEIGATSPRSAPRAVW